MICELIAHTSLVNRRAMADAGYTFHTDEQVTDPDDLVEFASRGCLELWNRPDLETATNRGYLRHVLEEAHATLEHASASFFVAGVSRSLLTELQLHHGLSFSTLAHDVESTNSTAAVSPTITDQGLVDQIRLHQRNSAIQYESLVAQLVSKGLKRQQAREAARAVLPNSTETRFMVSGNLWAWHRIVGQHLGSGANAEVRELARLMLAELRLVAPNIFQDLH